MAGENQVSISFASEEMAKYQEAIKTLENLIPKLMKISAENRQELPKMGDKTVGFVMKSLQYADDHANLVPPYIDKEEWNKDFKAVQDIRSIQVPLQKISDMLNDTAIIAGSEAYTASLVFYNAIKNAAKANVPGAIVAYQDMKARFPGGGRPAAGDQAKAS